MSDLAMYIMVIAAIGIGVMVISKRFLRKNDIREYNYRPKSKIEKEKLSLEERISFRKKPRNTLAENSRYSYRQAFNKNLKEAGRISNVELNRTFWIALGILVTLVLLLWYA